MDSMLTCLRGGTPPTSQAPKRPPPCRFLYSKNVCDWALTASTLELLEGA
mgnify:FL=1